MSRNILLVDDDERVLKSLARVLNDGRTRVRSAASAEAALACVAEARPHLVLSDVRMPGMGGLELLTLLKERAPEVDVVLMTAYEDLSTVAGAMREGAADFLVKPLDLHQLRAVVERVFRDRTGTSAAGGVGDADAAIGPADLVGRDPAMLEIFKMVGQLASNRTTVVIRGESGTGKEIIARAIHAHSSAAAEPFVSVNCTAIPETLLESELFGHVRGAFTGATADRKGRFAQAGSGTILLDEIGDTTPEFQAKLLRVLQEQEFHPVGADRAIRTEARVLAATHRDLEALVEEGRFREDLYYRLRVVELHVPPLRERRTDIPALAAHLLAKAARAAALDATPRLSEEAMDRFMAHDWPGNVRELENCIMRAVVLARGGVIRPEHLALMGGNATQPRLATLDTVEGEHVAAVLAAAGGNRTRAAEILGISRPRLRRLIDKHDIE
ncbi:MAG: sigma-54 dependent transcriptional regulator [Gemmatimonadota bacterium]